MLAAYFSAESHGWLQIIFANISASGALLTLIYLLYCLAYNRYLHPLRNFPGPAWGSMTDFYHTYLFGTGRGHLKMLDLHKKYGPESTNLVNIGSIIRVSPNLLSFSDPMLLPEIYHRHDEKTPFYSTAMTGEKAPLVMSQSDSEHTSKVKMLSPTVCHLTSGSGIYSKHSQYSMGNIKLQEDTVDVCIQKTMHVLDTRFASQGRSFDLADYIRYVRLAHRLFFENNAAFKSGRMLMVLTK
ncbi:MAG: hypothetical protein Q9168_003942 [Polycauliona sp. 1 TL-2023]